MRELVRSYFDKQLIQYIEWINSRGLSAMAREDASCEMLDHDDHLDSHRLTLAHLPVERFKRKMDVSDEDWFDSLPNAITELRKGRRDMLRAVLEAAERGDGYSYGTIAREPIPPSQPPSAALGQAVEDFIVEHSRQWPEKTAKQVRAYLNILIEYFGSNRLLATISKTDASEIKKVLQALPSSRNTIPALKNLTLMEATQAKGYKTISPKTINSHIDACRRFFDWAERHGHAPHKLFEGMKVPKAKDAATERRPYTQEQARLIFTELTDNPSRLVRSDSHKWAALLGMFTGARLNEICQLEIADIKQNGDIWYLNITDEGDNKKRVKARASRRKVPLHPELIRLGLLDFVKGRSKGTRLFPDYSYSANGGYGRSLGRWYNETFLPKLGMKEPGLVFHCLRHTMVTRLAQAGVAEPVYQCLVGHAREGVTQEVYMREGFTLVQLSEAIEKFQVEVI